MDFVTSADGTAIAYERSGTGAPLVLVAGAFNDRNRLAPLAQALESHFTAVTYDRRGRGDSGDTAPYAIDREIDDLDALIAAVGGSAAVFGYSSGALLGLYAGLRGSAITGLALYEAPPIPATGVVAERPVDLPERLSALIEGGRPGDAVALFQTAIGLPAETIAQLRQSPMWPALEAMAQSVVYDATLTRSGSLPVEALAGLTIRTLVLTGADSWPALITTGAELADLLPDAEHRAVTGRDHDIEPAAVAAELTGFFG